MPADEIVWVDSHSEAIRRQDGFQSLLKWQVRKQPVDETALAVHKGPAPKKQLDAYMSFIEGKQDGPASRERIDSSLGIADLCRQRMRGFVTWYATHIRWFIVPHIAIDLSEFGGQQPPATREIA